MRSIAGWSHPPPPPPRRDRGGERRWRGTGGSDLEFYSLNAGFSNFELDLFGRVRNLARAAQEQVFASEEAQRSTRISLIAEIANAWLTMAADQDQLRVARETLTTFRQTLDLTTAQFRIGVGSELEVRQAETNFQAARNDIATLETRVAHDQNALNLLVGTTVPADQLPAGLGQRRSRLTRCPRTCRPTCFSGARTCCRPSIN